MLHHLLPQHHGGLQHLTLQLQPLLRFQQQPHSSKIPHLQTELVTSQLAVQAQMFVARLAVLGSASLVVA